jgi:hypothetical protein
MDLAELQDLLLVVVLSCCRVWWFRERFSPPNKCEELGVGGKRGAQVAGRFCYSTGTSVLVF